MNIGRALSALLPLVFLPLLAQAQWNPCDSLICDAPKKCIVENEIAQCTLPKNDGIAGLTGSSFAGLFGSALAPAPAPVPAPAPAPATPLGIPMPQPSQNTPVPPPALPLNTAPAAFTPTPAPPTTQPGLFGLFTPPPPASQNGAAGGGNDPLAPLLKLFSLPTPAPAPGMPTPPPTTAPTQPPPPLFTLPTAPTTTQVPVIEPDVCILPPVTGNCNRARILWYYDTESQSCERFSFSGCGNSNRFESKAACERRCLKRAK